MMGSKGAYISGYTPFDPEPLPPIRWKKYAAFKVAGSIYVSSSGHWFVPIVFYVLTNREAGNYTCAGRMYWSLGDDALEVENRRVKLPKYAKEAVEVATLEYLKSADCKFHEYNRDGVKRFDNLRYVSNEDKAWFIGVLEQKHPAPTAG